MSLQFTERQLPMFELRFADRLDPAHELLRAAALIDWDSLQDALSKYYSPLGDPESRFASWWACTS
jgi:hypothetical protein